MIEYRDEVLRTNAVVLPEAKKLPVLETQSTALDVQRAHLKERECVCARVGKGYVRLECCRLGTKIPSSQDAELAFVVITSPCSCYCCGGNAVKSYGSGSLQSRTGGRGGQLL